MLKKLILIFVVVVGLYFFGDVLWGQFAEQRDNVVQEYEEVKGTVEEVSDKINEVKEGVQDTVDKASEVTETVNNAATQLGDTMDNVSEKLNREESEDVKE